MLPAIVITHLHLYPIKSCAALDLDAAYLGPRGLEAAGVGDRRWMLADEAGMMITQRQRPALARVKVALEAGVLRVTGDGLEPIILDPSMVGSERVSVILHGREAVGHQVPRVASDWFSRFLGAPATLIYQKDDDLRLCDDAFAVIPGTDRVGFADAYPYLLTTAATLDAVNRAMDRPVPMNRFRPNIVVGGNEPDAEYGWKRLSIGTSAELTIVKPCTRCVMTTIDQAGGSKTGIEPLATLGRDYFLSAHIGSAHVQGAIFGENAIATRCGAIRVGDAVTVLETKPPYLFRAGEHL
jgi:uncharacterized protein YcbX